MLTTLHHIPDRTAHGDHYPCPLTQHGTALEATRGGYSSDMCQVMPMQLHYVWCLCLRTLAQRFVYNLWDSTPFASQKAYILPSLQALFI